MNKGKEENEKIDELVDMIDRLMEDGDGHVSVSTNDDSEGLTVKTYRSNDCGTKGACCQPNEKSEDDE